PVAEIGATAVFAPCEGDVHPDDFTVSDGQVTFLLPRDGDSAPQATVNLSLAGEPMGWENQQYNQIGAIKTEFEPLNENTQALGTFPTPVSDIQPSPVGDLAQPKPSAHPSQTPPPTTKGEPPQPTQTPLPNTSALPTPTQPNPSAQPTGTPPPTANAKPPATVTEKPMQENIEKAIPPPPS
ncbi:MAG: hypothetical protein RR052_05660, partial [Oscillospiraceae bacterium]